jgi:hypothetical protein
LTDTTHRVSRKAPREATAENDHLLNLLRRVEKQPSLIRQVTKLHLRKAQHSSHRYHLIQLFAAAHNAIWVHHKFGKFSPSIEENRLSLLKSLYGFERFRLAERNVKLNIETWRRIRQPFQSGQELSGTRKRF